ncbi:hypothetical protein V8E53_000909, partial [Lactarius tabidus]
KRWKSEHDRLDDGTHHQVIAVPRANGPAHRHIAHSFAICSCIPIHTHRSPPDSTFIVCLWAAISSAAVGFAYSTYVFLTFKFTSIYPYFRSR